MNVTTVTIQGCHSQMRYTPTLFQYDYGQILKIEGVELPETFQAHFCNVSDSSTKTVLGSNNQVSIPDEYLDTGEDILCYIYLHTGEEDGETEYKIFIPVTARQSITDEEPTPEEQSIIDQLVSALNSGVARAETAATNAETSEENAKTSEENAAQSESNAKASEESALQAKDDAETAKTGAEEAEANATQKATEAEGSATRASASATLSQSWAVGGTGTRQGEDTNNSKYYAESAISAKDAAVLAKTQAESARDLAVQAKNSAETAAQTATQKASEATQSAASASQSASSASASSTSASQSAALATSAKEAAETAQGLAEDARDEAVNAKDDAEAAAQSIAQSASQIAQNTEDISDLKSAVNQMYPTDTASGVIASFPDGAKDVPVDSLIVNIEPVQKGSGDPSPENIRPITGHEEVSVVRCGKNLWHSDIVIKDGYLTKSDGVVVCTGSPVSVGTTVLLGSPAAPINLKLPAGTYTLTGTSETFSDIYAQLADGTTWRGTKTFPNGATINRIRCNNAVIANGEYYWQLQIEKGSATAYEPYQGETYTIELGDTIYGGTLDVTTGELTVDRAMVDLRTLNWSFVSPSEWNCWMSSGIVSLKAKGAFNIICSKYAVSAVYGTTDNNIISGNTSNGNVYIRDTSYSNPASFKASLNGVQLVYELAEPITIQLTPQQITTLLGTNNFYADTGDTEVTYKADIQLYIQKKISAAVAALS